MGERYGKLPSEILRSGTTTDLFVFDTAAAYRMEKQRAANGTKEPAKLSTDELLKKMEKFKSDQAKP